MKRTIKRIVTVLLLMLSVSVAAQESALLQYNIKEGDKYLVFLKLNQDMSPIMKIAVDVSMNMRGLKAEKGNLKSSYRFDDVKLTIGGQGQEVTYDSKDKDKKLNELEEKLKETVTPVLETVIYQTIDRSGKMVEQKSEREVKGVAGLLNDFTNIEYPKTPVKVGSSWDTTRKVNGMNIDLKFIVTKITKESVYTDISVKVGDVKADKAEGKAKISRKSGMMEDMYFDVEISDKRSLIFNFEMNSKKM